MDTKILKLNQFMSDVRPRHHIGRLLLAKWGFPAHFPKERLDDVRLAADADGYTIELEIEMEESCCGRSV